MYLQSLQVENFRGVREGYLTFDESIVLIGENDSGKTSLLDALNMVLNSKQIEQNLELRHFYCDKNNVATSGALKISLSFEEKYPEEWSNEIYSPIKEILQHSKEIKQRIVLELKARFKNNDSISIKWKLINKQTNISSENPSIIQWVRRVNPIIRLSAGMLTGNSIENFKKIPNKLKHNSFPEKLQAQIQKVQDTSIAVLTSNNINLLSDIEEGYNAALILNDYLTKLPGFDGIKLSIGNRLNIKDVAEYKKINNGISKTGSNSEKLGTLLVMNALIHACGNTSLNEVDPIWILEDPEAHLHKISLASVSNIISGIRGQKVITTNSGGLLASIPIHQVRRLVRTNGIISEYFVKEHALSTDDIRRINYHVRAHRNSAFFSRVWLLVEGESEFWILPHLARLLGYDFRLEGITCVEYAQSGLRPLIKIAEQLNIKWLMVTDGDKAGEKYANQARSFTTKENQNEKVCVFPAHDIEQYLWFNGYDNVYIKHAHTHINKDMLVPSRTIKSAVSNYSKPHLALSIIEAASAENSPGVPAELIKLIENCVRIARLTSM